MSPAAEGVIRRLDAARQKWWLFTLLCTTVVAACVSLGTLLIFVLTDALVRFGQFALLAMFLVWLGVTTTLIVVVGRRLLRSQRGLEATARRVEMEMPELQSSLINIVQLSEDPRHEARAFCDAAINAAAARIGQMRFEEAADKESRWRRFVYCMQTPRDLAESLGVLGVLIAAAVICHLFLANWGSAASRLMTPWRFVPAAGSLEIEVSPGDAEIIVGNSLEISGRIKNPAKTAHEATLFVTPENEAEQSLPMAADKDQQLYKLVLPAVARPLAYRLEIGDSQTPIYHVTVCEKPAVDEVKVTLNFPAYLRRASETFAQKTADLEAPQYSVADLAIRPSAPITAGHIQCEGQKILGRVEEGGMLLTASMPLLKNTTFTIHLFKDQHTDPSPRVNRVHVLPDNPPTVELLKPPRQSTTAPGAEVPLSVRAADDHGLSMVRLEIKVKTAETEGTKPAEAEPAVAPQPPETETAKPLQQWTEFDNAATVVRHHTLKLDPQEIKPGQTVFVRAVARDQRLVTDWGLNLQRQEAPSGWHAIQIVDAAAKTSAALEQLDGLRAAIMKILERQIQARIRASGILQQQQLAERAAAAGEVRTQQVDIQKSSADLVGSIGQTDRPERIAIKRIISQLAAGDMLQAVRQCDGLVRLKSADAFVQPVPELVARQERIIDVLRKLLDVSRQAQDDVLAEAQKRPGSDLPDDVQKKLDQARKKLEEFLEQQKKVIEASESLAKKPVEDFTEEEKQKLRELAATEDDWSKFMTELNTDLSKLPEQDFANASLAKELVEIQTEIKMAEDALLKKSVDIAVPLEQLGYEMAEELKTNLEKWLPDTPDREKWSQEESLSDKDKEAPMAELPGELEDLVGELMEEEEDLFDEMEDVSSSAADSIDKGAGWDALDGPISNMSAKGVTGNRLPNTSEIGGRSGEGRSGKSSGEFVGDEAVGKGGRKTPSRLTPDPYVKGQIKDHSKDPTGGATGGGKESGQGGEGLEGPVPRAPGPRDLERLAGKQAALRNKAEGVDMQFQVMNFHHTDLKKMIEMMAQIERDLRAGRYQNVLRQRRLLAEGLGNVKQYLEGEFEVRQDTTSNLPTDIQKELLGSMQDPSPAGWEELNRQYFERLSGGGGTGEKTPAAEGLPSKQGIEN